MITEPIWPLDKGVNSVRVMVTVLKATFKNISILSWRSVLLVEETRENHKSLTNFIT
jgi:hypothetical protein